MDRIPVNLVKNRVYIKPTKISKDLATFSPTVYCVWILDQLLDIVYLFLGLIVFDLTGFDAFIFGASDLPFMPFLLI